MKETITSIAIGKPKFRIEQQKKKPEWDHQRQRELKQALSIVVEIDDFLSGFPSRLDIYGIIVVGILLHLPSHR